MAKWTRNATVCLSEEELYSIVSGLSQDCMIRREGVAELYERLMLSLSCLEQENKKLEEESS